MHKIGSTGPTGHIVAQESGHARRSVSFRAPVPLMPFSTSPIIDELIK
jgi:hypothetical protein